MASVVALRVCVSMRVHAACRVSLCRGFRLRATAADGVSESDRG